MESAAGHIAPNRVLESLSSPQSAPCVTGRAFALGLLLSCALSAFNCWIETALDVHFLGGVQMPFGAIFGLLFFVLFVNIPLRLVRRHSIRRAAPFTPVELLTIYLMLLFAMLVSTPGTDNFFLTTGPTLFYFSTPENRWAELFYQFLPSWMAPGWNGQTYQTNVIEPLYTGGLSFSSIPWHVWSAMLLAWGVFLTLIYATLFFLSLALRRQWIENESLTFPLLQLPLQMVEVEDEDKFPPSRAFWSNKGVWAGFVLACAFHGLRGLNDFSPGWPLIGGFQGNPVWILFTERPWNAIHNLSIQYYLGAIGVAFLLTREVSFSFWFFLLLYNLELVFAESIGFVTRALPEDAYLGRPMFLTSQSIGGWGMTAILLLWTAREHLGRLCREAIHPQAELASSSTRNEPFAPRFVVSGFTLSFAGLLIWSWFAGIHVAFALCFFAIYILSSLVLARLVVEGGFLFPQLTFTPLEWMSSGLASGVMSASNLTKLSLLQPVLTSDMRTNVLPGFLHTLKVAHAMKLNRSDTRRLLGSVCMALNCSLAMTVVTSIATLYARGGLSVYKWFSYLGPQQSLRGAARMMKEPRAIEYSNLVWTGVGALVVWLMTWMRARFLWFPLHPLGFIVATSFPTESLWFSFFVGWLVKTLLLKYGGYSAVQNARPFMLGLILGNVCAMVFWMLVGFGQGQQISYFPS